MLIPRTYEYYLKCKSDFIDMIKLRLILEVGTYLFGPDVIKMVLTRRTQEESEEKEISPTEAETRVM